MAMMEELDGLVERRAVDDRVVRRQRHPEHVRVLVLERAGQVIVDLVEAQRQRLLDRAAQRPRRLRGPGEGREPVQRRRLPRSGTRRPGRRRQVERLQHERRHAPRPGAAVVGRVRQDQLVAGTGHGHVEQPPLLGEECLGGLRLAPAEATGERERLASTREREPPGDQARQEHDRKLEPLRLVDREHGDGIRVRIELRGGRVVARLDERLEMACHEHRPVVRKQGRLRPDDLEEAGDVLERLFGGDAVGAGQARQQPGPAQERVEHLARRPLVRERAVGTQVRDEPA